MNLYIFNELSKAAVYGIGTCIRELTKALQKSHINVCAVNLFSDKPQIQIEEADGIRLWYFPAAIPERRTIEHKKQNELYYTNVVYLLQLYIEEKTDLIFHLNYNHSVKLAEELKRVFDCRIVTTIHYLEWAFGVFGNVAYFRKIVSMPKAEYNDEKKQKIEESYRNEQMFFETVDHIICLSENTRQILQNDYQLIPDKISVIYNGLTDGRLTFDKRTLRQKYHIPDIPVIIFAGRLEDIKGLAYALRAFRIVLNSLPHCHFIIAGKGSFDTYLKECEDIWMHITWTGLINKDKLYELYQIADVGVMPSLYEPFGYVAVEMMMHGLPLVATATSGLNEVVDDTCGLKIPLIEQPDRVEIDTDLLAEKIIYLLQHPEEARKMGRNGRKRYLKEYTSEVFRRNMLNFYQSLYTDDTQNNTSNLV